MEQRKMIPLTPSRAPLIAPPNPDDRSSNGHRQTLGILGIALPLVLAPVAGQRSIKGPDQWWEQLNSISAYYHTGAEVLFIGIVMALGIFLITYEGYSNSGGSKDRWISTLAGVAAVVLAFFPTEADGPYTSPEWWDRWMEAVHFTSAALLFGSFAFMALFLFTKGHGPLRTRLKEPRVMIHIACGGAIVLCMVGLAIFDTDYIFWPEAIMLWAFGISWLVKGKVDETVEAAAQRVTGRKKKPEKMVN